AVFVTGGAQALAVRIFAQGGGFVLRRGIRAHWRAVFLFRLAMGGFFIRMEIGGAGGLRRLVFFFVMIGMAGDMRLDMRAVMVDEDILMVLLGVRRVFGRRFGMDLGRLGAFHRDEGGHLGLTVVDDVLGFVFILV